MSAEKTSQAIDEAPLDPQRPIVDPHHHFWDIPPAPPHTTEPIVFFLPDLLAMIARSGHNVTQTVFAECMAMYRADGPAEMRPIGETEFANGIAAMSASGRYGPRRIAAGIIGSADLTLGDEVTRVLEAHIAAGNGRFRGIRTWTAYTEHGLFGRPCDPALDGLMRTPRFRAGTAALARLGLTLDVWCVHTQIAEVADLATAVPNTTIILDHIGSPLNFGPYAGREAEVFAAWKKDITELARRPNVVVKVGGIGMPLASFGMQKGCASSSSLAPKWRPYIETCIAAFGANRCMFESNFPPDEACSTYGALWNTFKLVTAEYSEGEKTALFSDTARRTYRLP